MVKISDGELKYKKDVISESRKGGDFSDSVR